MTMMGAKRPIGDGVGIEQETHRSTSRRPSLVQTAFSPDSRNGDAAKNAAKEQPFRSQPYPPVLIWRSLLCPLGLRSLGPPGKVCGKTRKSIVQRFSRLASRHSGGVQRRANGPDR